MTYHLTILIMYLPLYFLIQRAVKKIAVIDDEELIRNVLTQLLERAGYEVLPYADAAPALEECDFDAADLILTDLAMPTRGEVLIQILKDRGVETPIVVLSGNLEGQSEKLREMGVEEIFQKPLKVKTLLEVVERLV